MTKELQDFSYRLGKRLSGNNRKQTNKRGVNPRAQPAQYVPVRAFYETVVTRKGKPEKAMMSVMTRKFRKILNTRPAKY